VKDSVVTLYTENSNTFILFKLFIPIYIQQDATLHSLFISGNCSTCLGSYLHPSSGGHTTVSTASGICHTFTAICRDRIYTQQDATLHSLFISGNCSTCLGSYLHPSSGEHTTVSTASGICHTVTAISRDRIYTQKDATLHSLFITGNCSTCFGWYFHPSSGAHTTVSTASGICHTVTAVMV
jgi:hypothetical protein